MKMEYKYSPKTWEDTEEIRAGYHTCECCGKQSSYTGRQYWYNGHLHCKHCLLEKLLEDQVVYNNQDDL